MSPSAVQNRNNTHRRHQRQRCKDYHDNTKRKMKFRPIKFSLLEKREKPLPCGWNFPLWSADPTIWTWQWPVCMHTCKDNLPSAHSAQNTQRKAPINKHRTKKVKDEREQLLHQGLVPSTQGREVLCLFWLTGKEQDLLLACSPEGTKEKETFKCSRKQTFNTLWLCLHCSFWVFF